MRLLNSLKPLWLSAAADRCSATYPYLWRTRTVFYVAAGLGATLTVALGAWSLVVDRTTLPTPLSFADAYTGWTILLYLGLGLVVFDALRRVGPLYTISQAARVFGCLTLSALCLSLPQYAFINIVLARVAKLESAEDLSALQRRSGTPPFWGCFDTVDSLQRAAGSGRDLIVEDLSRYGLTTNFELAISPCISLLAWASDGSSGVSSQVQNFGLRLQAIAAAQAYVRGNPGEYDTVLMIHAWQLVLLAVAAGALGAVAGATSLWRVRAVRFRRPRLLVPGWSRKYRSEYGEWFASRWPILWASVSWSTLPVLLLSPVVWMAALLNDSSSFAAGALLIQLIGIGMVLFAESRSRVLTATRTVERGVVLVYAVVVGVGFAMASLMPLGTEMVGTLVEFLGIGLGATLFLLGLFVSARTCGIVFALLGFMTALAAVGGLFLSSGGLGMTELFVIPVLTGVALRSRRLEAWPAASRLMVSTFVAYLALSGFVGSLWVMSLSNWEVSEAEVMLSFAGGIAALILGLRWTESTRRALQYAR